MSFTINSQIIKISFVGASAMGAISVPGLKVGDVILGAQAGPAGSGIPGGIGLVGAFENGLTTISVDDEIQQTVNSDFSSITLTFFLVR